MTLPTYHVPSDAAKEFARTIDHDHDDIADYVRWTHCQHAAAFDAGCAHALAAVTPRTISTSAELDALPVGSIVTDGDRDAWQKNRDGEWVMAGCEGAYSSRHVFSDAELKHPVTLLAEAPADPDDEKRAILAQIAQPNVDHLATLTAAGWTLTKVER